MKLENAVLFYRPTCPYCRRVLEYMDEVGIEVDKRNVLEGDNQTLLEEVSGQDAVPVLVANGQPIIGFDVIIEYLQEVA